MNPYTKSLLFLAIGFAGSYGAIYDQVSQLPTYTYDYIIVGGASNDERLLSYDRFVIIVRWCCWKYACKSLDRKQQNPSPSLRGRREVCPIYLQVIVICTR